MKQGSRQTNGEKWSRAFTLIELMITVMVIGVLSALAIYGVRQYLESAKSAEARTFLGRIGKDHLAVFEEDIQGSAVLPFGSSAGITRSLCPDAGPRPLGIGTPASPVSIPAIRSAKWQPSPADFRDPGWACLKFSTVMPLYYGYGMDSNQTGDTAVAGDGFLAYAIGDVDGDSEPATFELGGMVRASASGNTALVLATTIQQSRAE